MDFRDLLTDAFSRIHQVVAGSVDGMTLEQLAYRPDPDANSISWLVWHLTRIQDDHLSELAGREQEWIAGGWNARFGTDPDRSNTGFGHSSRQVAEVAPDTAEILAEFYNAVFRRTLEYLDTVDDQELDRIVDRSYDPPVSAGVRLVSVISDNLQHAGQARYVRGMVERLDFG